MSMKASETTAMPTKEQIVAVIDTTAVVCDGPFDGVVIDNTEEVADAILALFSRSPVKAIASDFDVVAECHREAAPAPVLTRDILDELITDHLKVVDGFVAGRKAFVQAVLDRLTKQAPQPEEKV